MISRGMGLIRIAFGRSLSSYLTFLQGSVVSLQDSSEKRQMSVVELHHKTHDMTVILERLAHLCQCVSESSPQNKGFTLMSILKHCRSLLTCPDLLTRIYEEILEQPVTSDPLWVALLLSFLDQASKPYRDILSRWLGITPSAHAGHERSQLSRIANARRLSTDMRRNGGSAIGVRRGSVKEAGDCLFSIFDAHLQQSLQGLDPFGEFFVESKHGWSWDGAEPIILGDPLDYEDEFRMHRSVKPAGFIDYRLAERVMEAGKELQILNEFESRHPLIAHDRNTDTRSNGLKWFYVRGDIAAHRHRYEKSRTEVLQALAMRLRSKGWVARRRTHRKQMQATKASASEQDQTYRLSVAADKMDMDAFPAEDQTSIDSPTLDLGLDPELQGFFSLSSGLGQSKEMSLACPDMMAFLLGPSSPQASLACSPKSSSPSEFSTVPGVTCSGTGSGSSDVYSCTAPTPAPARMRLENMAPLAVLAEQSLCDSIRARTSLVNTCVMSLYFHDLNLLGHFEVMERFMLMKDGQFVAKLSEALFLDETGLLNRCAVHAANEAGDGTAGASTTTARDRSSMASNASGGTTGASTLRRNMRLKWPPRSGELEMTLRAVLLECFQLSSNEGETLQQSTNSERSESESDVSDMDIEETDPDRSSKLLYRAVRRGKLRSTVNRAVDVHELEESLAFAVKEYDDMSKICQDANALEALDFLYLDYKAPRPLRLMLFTPPVFEKYTRLFTFQLRLARVDAALKHVYTQLRTRQKDLANLSLAKKDPRQNLLQVVRIELQLLHRFRFEAQHILDSLRGYIADVALGLTWQTFMNRLRDLQSRIEDRILFSETEAVRDDSSEDDGGKIIMDGLGLGQGDEELEDLADLQGYHDRVLDQMLLQALLKRKQAPILKVVHGILNSMLKLSQFVQQLPETDISSPPEFLDKDVVQKRIAKLQTLQEKFRSMCRMLVKVLKVLDERGTGTGGTNTATTMQTTATAIGVTSGNGNGQGSTCAQSIESEFLQQLLLRLDMSGFNSN
ncbi:hypothetical protein BGX28_002417 [Mortierella sp. GBA30]|nr:hypothetical protein BGX28_002417 [Mortierella sp. GBA30]